MKLNLIYMGYMLKPADQETKDFLEANYKPHGMITFDVDSSPDNPKTASQRGSLHRWFDLLANELNDAGLDQRVVLRAGQEIPWTKNSVKQQLYKPILKAMSNKTSTEDMNTKEPSEICKVVGRRLAEKFGVTPPAFPNRHGEG